MVKNIRIDRKIIALIIITLVFTVISTLHLTGAFNYLEYKSYDLRVRLLADYKIPSDNIIVILLKQDCLDWAQKERGWGWPWPREAYAEIVNYMSIGKAESLTFDLVFFEPSLYRNARQDEIIDDAVRFLESVQSGAETMPRGELSQNIINSLQALRAREDDAVLAKAASDNGKIVQAVFFSTRTGNEDSWPINLNAPLFNPVNFGEMLYRFNIGGMVNAQLPISELRNSANALGCITSEADQDGIIRRLRLFTLFDGKAVPGLAAASLIAGGTGTQVSYNKKKSSLEWEGYNIPVNKKGETLLNYRGDLDRYNLFSASEILQNIEAYSYGEEVLIPPEKFAGAYVFFGHYAPGLFDIYPTPISPVYPGVGCHITMLDNLLNGDFIRESKSWINMLILFAVTAAAVILTMFSRRIRVSAGGIVLITIIITAVSFAACGLGGLWMPMVTLITGIFAAFIVTALYIYFTDGNQKRFIKSVFSRYLSPKVIDRIILDPSQLKLGGEKLEMTAVFTGIRGFSVISEALGDPEKLVTLLNFYLTRMSGIVLDNQGTVDKYEGGAIRAFFGAPVHAEDHAALACRAALIMKKAEVEINREVTANGFVTKQVTEALKAKGIMRNANESPLFTRLGINTGGMVVGNMGTANKMDYTIMGDAVNLAARLEGVNKQYNTGGILISEYTREHIGSEFVTRPLSRVRAAGINIPLRLFELLDITTEATSELLSMVKNWNQAFKLYESRDFSAAKTIFSAVYDLNSKDLAAKKYMDRCVKYISAPPDEKTWNNGVDDLIWFKPGDFKIYDIKTTNGLHQG
ncbi:MAG: CHASE2 domain-containing protein [Treponema sp.]|nr:CHASE2 domain-containing protein [Treponema sp.]